LFNKRFFVFYKNISNIVEASIFIFFIIGQGKYIFKNILNNIFGNNIKNLIFYNIYIIKNFYINIISETRFRTQEIWYFRLDYILYYNIKYNNIIIKILIY
jgi:hypothetical protein